MTYKFITEYSLGEASKKDLRRFKRMPYIIGSTYHEGYFYILIESGRATHVKIDEDRVLELLTLLNIPLEIEKDFDDYEKVDLITIFFSLSKEELTALINLNYKL